MDQITVSLWGLQLTASGWFGITTAATLTGFFGAWLMVGKARHWW